ncbi:MAG: ATP-binding protein, partial [Actinomycetota bacterium]|nr:ATP-binding protein [Actinomycetota bacterium]
GVRLDVAVAGPLLAVVDPDRLGQVVANLVENALKHADRSVRVAALSTADSQRIEVVDDGAGISPDERDRVFDRLYAGQRVARRQVGSGLGLAIVAELVGAMGGAVRCTSTAGGGTTMSVEVPRPIS